MTMNFDQTINALLAFAYYYPLFMSYVWICGGLYYRYHWERGQSPDQAPQLQNYPPVSILVPCFNEEQQIEETVAHLATLNYPAFEVVCINDGSSDATGAILDRLQLQYPLLRV